MFNIEELKHHIEKFTECNRTMSFHIENMESFIAERVARKELMKKMESLMI
jgi:hypothetical protein